MRPQTESRLHVVEAEGYIIIVINLSSKTASRIHPVKEINLAAKAKDVGFTPHKGTGLYYFGWHAKCAWVFPR